MGWRTKLKLVLLYLWDVRPTVIWMQQLYICVLWPYVLHDAALKKVLTIPWLAPRELLLMFTFKDIHNSAPPYLSAFVLQHCHPTSPSFQWCWSCVHLSAASVNVVVFFYMLPLHMGCPPWTIPKALCPLSIKTHFCCDACQKLASQWCLDWGVFGNRAVRLFVYKQEKDLSSNLEVSIWVYK